MGAAELRECPRCREHKINKHFRSRRGGRFHQRCKPCRVETIIELLQGGV